jgi:uncharacterized OB-fold protein
VGKLPADWGVPVLTETNRVWFSSGSLAVQRCVKCAALQHPPEEICHRCGSTEFDHRVVAPRGTVHSYTVAHYPAHPDLADSVPYGVILVSLDELPEVRVIGNIPHVDPASIRIGMSVEAYWEERTAEDGSAVLLPQWRPV